LKSTQATPEEKLAVVRVCDEYFRNIALGHYSQAEGMIAWAEYEPLKEGVTRAMFTERIVANKSRWTIEQHPLLGVDILDVKVRGDYATVLLEKKALQRNYEIKLVWAGRGWLILADNLFTENGVYR